MSFLVDVGLALLFAGPIFFSNAIPSVLGGGYPIDSYKNFFDGKRILGDHKTLQGLINGILFGFFTGVIIWYTVGETMNARYEHLGFQYPFWIGILFGWGANFGDLLGSFIKRRINIKSGGKFPVFDQLGYMVFGILWAWPVYRAIPWQFWVSLLIFAPLLHILSNLFAYAIKAKDVPW